MTGALHWVRVVPWRQWPDTVVAVGVAVGIEVGLRVLRLARLARLLGVPLAVEAPQPSPAGLISQPPRPDTWCPLPLPPWANDRITTAERVMRHWPAGGTCLRAALLCGHRIRALGPRLCIGIATVDGTVRAHAWLQVAGHCLDPNGASHYQVLTPVRGPDA